MKRESLYVPYDYPVTPEIIRLKDGGAVTTFCCNGVDTSMMGSQAITALHELRALANQSLRGDGWTMHLNIIRRQETELNISTPTNPQLAAMDQRARQAVVGGGIFVNDVYLSLVRHAGLSASSKSRHWLMRKKDRAAMMDDWVNDLDQYADRFCAIMRPFDLRRIGCTTINDGVIVNDQATLFGQLVNAGYQQPMLLSDNIDQYISVRRKTFKGNAFVASDVGANTWGSMMAVEQYAAVTRPNVLDKVLSLPFELIISQSFSADDFDDTNSAIEWQKHRLDSIHGESAEELIEQLIRDKKHIATGGVGYGQHHISITPLVQQQGDDKAGAYRTLNRYCNDITGAFAQSGITIKREVTNAPAMFYAMLPGALHDAGPRRRRINTRNWASFAPFTRIDTGQLSGHHWGDATAIFPTLDRTRRAVSFHSGDVGHFAALGKTGQGKTAIIIYLFLMLARHPNRPRCVILDKDNSAEIAVRYAGGIYHDIQIGVDTGYNPFYHADDAARMTKAAEFLFQLLLITGCIDSSDNRDRVAGAVKHACSLGEGHRNIDEIAGFLSNNGEGSPGHAMAPWCKGGRYYWAFGSKIDTFSTDARYIGINLTEIIEHKELGEPITMYLLDRIKSMINGDPLALYIEEAWQTIQKPAFLSAFIDFEKTMRKFNGLIGFGTQDAADLAKSPAAHSLISNLSTLICAPHPDALPESYDGFQLTPEHIKAICELPLNSRQYFIKTGSYAGVIDGDLSGLGEFIEVLSSDPRKRAICDRVRAQYGDNPADWAPHFFKEVRHGKGSSHDGGNRVIDGVQFSRGTEAKPVRLQHANG